MCNRFTLHSSPGAIAYALGLSTEPDVKPRYNVAPTQVIAAVRSEDGSRQFVPMRWGLIPAWADGPMKIPMFNARSETAAQKPAFHAAFKTRRCLIPADGFFEWIEVAPKKKQPLYFRAADDRVMAFAGLWEQWSGGEKPVLSCTILTTEAGDDVKDVHDRMPVILSPEQFDAWMDPETPLAEIQAMLRPLPAGSLYYVPVNPVVGNSRFDDPACIEQIGEGKSKN